MKKKVRRKDHLVHLLIALGNTSLLLIFMMKVDIRYIFSYSFFTIPFIFGVLFGASIVNILYSFLEFFRLSRIGN